MERHTEALYYALQVLKQDKFKKYIEAIYLYGSCARGTQKYDSDVDLMIKVSNDTPGQLLRQMRVAVTPDYNLPEVELKFFSGTYYTGSPQFDKNVDKDGILLWKKK